MKPILALACASAVFTAAGSAAAHVVIAVDEAAPGAHHVASFRVGHGCEGYATTALRVELPPGIASAKPAPKPGWTVEVADGVVTWRGSLPDAAFDEFALLVRLPATPGPLYFPTVQTCETGERRWVQLPALGAAWTSVPNPAPVVNIVAPPAAADAHTHH